MVVTAGISAIIREAKTHQIYSAIQTGGKQGMCTMEQSLANLCRDGLITTEDALSKANHPLELKNLARIE
jgi:twitching motility protein PilT